MKIPIEVRNTINRLSQEADEASILASRCVEQVNALQKQTGIINDPDELKATLAEIERLTGVRNGHQQRSRALSALVSSIGHWSRSLPDGTHLELVQSGIEVLEGEAVVEAVGRIRTEIATLQSERSRVRQARAPKGDLKEKVAAYIAERARRGAPRVNLSGSGLEVDFAPPTFEAGSVRHMVDVLCWIDPAKVQKRIEAQIDAMPADDLAMTASERAERLADLESQIEQLERQEEAGIRLCEESGLKSVTRRQHASPVAILGIRIVKDKAKRSRAA